MRKSYSMVRELAESNIDNLFQCAIDGVLRKSAVSPIDWLKDIKSALWFAYMSNIICDYEYIYLENAIDAIVWG